MSDYAFSSYYCKDGYQNVQWYNNNSCSNSLWLKSYTDQWTMTPMNNSTNVTHYIRSTSDSRGAVGSNHELNVRPVVYLKENVRLLDTNTFMSGSSSYPYLIKLY